MSDEIKKSVLNTLAEPISNSAKNITDKPTQNIGTTLADIWYLVFGCISQAAEKRKLKYSYDLQEFEKELQGKISKIPEDKLVEPDIQVVAPALESSKYCVEKKELRELFSNLISSSMNSDSCKDAHPIFTNVIRQLSIADAKLLKVLFEDSNKHRTGYANIELDVSSSDMILSLSTLESLGLIYTNIKDNTYKYATKDELVFPHGLDLRKFDINLSTKDNKTTFHIHFTNLGVKFCNICIK